MQFDGILQIRPAIVVIKAIPIPFEKIVGSPNPIWVIASKDLYTQLQFLKSPKRGK